MRLFHYITAVIAFCLMPSSIMAQGKQYAVLVGVEQYQHSNLGNLEYAVEDVTELADVLAKTGYKVTLLTDDTGKKDKSLEPTQANIEKQIHDVLGKCRRDDTVLIALAGHGLQFTGQKDAFFCPVDARPFDDETASMVSISKIYREFEKSFAGVKVILVDACRNDPDPGRGRGGLDADAAPRPPRGVAALFSCSAGQRAFEHDDLKHGVFFHYVLEGLREKAADSDGEVTFSGLSLYVRKNVPRRIRQLFPNQRYDQFPNLKADLVGIPPVLARVELKPKATTKPKSMTLPKQEHAPKNGKLINNGIGMKLALIPAGEFLMGSSIPAEETAALFRTKTAYHTNEHPQHKVKITKPFHMATTEVTQKQWQIVMQSSPWRGLDATKEGDNFPATYVSWNDALVFCEKLTARERELNNLTANERYRLPTEAEWEYACRAGSKSLFCFGYDEDVLKQFAWLAENAWKARESYAHQTGKKKANDFGLFDMHGNVWEWCNDRYKADYYVLTPPADPQGPKTNNNPFARVLRGGSWRSDSQDLRCEARFKNSPNVRSSGTGFRVVKTIDPSSKLMSKSTSLGTTKEMSLDSEPALIVAPFSKQEADAKRNEWARHLGKGVIETDRTGMKLVLIPAGQFMMGSNKSADEIATLFNVTKDYYIKEHPQHEVQITSPFYLATTEVTQKQWRYVMNTEPWKGKRDALEGNNYPATNIDWNLAQDFIAKLNEVTSDGNYRLPTEAEWEYACRAGSEEMYSFGDDTSRTKRYAWFQENRNNDGKMRVHQTGMKLPNHFGLFDMHGNVWEWCQDWHGQDYYESSITADPPGPSTGRERILRGGAFHNSTEALRSAFRRGSVPSYSSAYAGFRVVKTIDLSTKPAEQKTSLQETLN